MGFNGLTSELGSLQQRDPFKETLHLWETRFLGNSGWVSRNRGEVTWLNG